MTYLFGDTKECCRCETLEHCAPEHCCRECERCSLSGKTAAVSHKAKHAITIPRNCTVGHVSQRNENLSAHKILYTDVHSSFIYNISKLESAQMFFNNLMVKQIVVYSVVIKRNRLLICVTTWMNFQEIMLGALSQSPKFHAILNAWCHLYSILKWKYFWNAEYISHC